MKKPVKIQLDTPKVIGDPLHGYIPLTDLEYGLLQLPTVNRLHYLRQTQTAYLTFPGSVSTRFSHVVGAMHIGHKMITQLLSTISISEFNTLFPKVGGSAEFIAEVVRLACLFHDVGHGPFSHAGEDAMIKVMKKIDSKNISHAIKLFKKENIEDVPIHEYYSYKLVTTEEILNEILHHANGGSKLVEAVSALLVKDDDLRFMKNNPLGGHLLRKIVSSQLDADRMDYLLRDSLMSGVQFGQVDVNRIIQNMALVKDGNDEYQISFHERSIGNIEDMLDARFKMYRWFYNHHTVMVTNELLKRAINIMVEEDEEVAKLFHWSEYKKGFSTDDIVLSKIREKINGSLKKQYLPFKGIINRQFLPVSLFKSTPDLGRMIDHIKKIKKTDTSDDTISKKITHFFKGDGARILKQKLDQHDDDLKKCIIFQTRLQMKPYKYFEETEEDLIYLHRQKTDDLCELYNESSYFKAINDEWTKFQTLYVFYLIPGRQKKDIKKYEEPIKNILAKAISEYKPTKEVPTKSD